MYTPDLGVISDKPVWYDFYGGRYRADIILKDGILDLKNQSSYWLGNDLFIYVLDAGFQSCIRLDMGFGMMRPDWFKTNATTIGGVWLAHKSDAIDNSFYYTAWNSKADGVSDFNFDYFS